MKSYRLLIIVLFTGLVAGFSMTAAAEELKFFRLSMERRPVKKNRRA